MIISARRPHWIYICVTIFLAILLSILPLPKNIETIWPDWINLVVFYWVLVLPANLGVMFGWIVGLLEDIVSFSLLGQHALGKALTGTIAALAEKRFPLFNHLERMFVIFIVQTLNVAIVASVNHLSSNAPVHAALWETALTTCLAWPLVAFLLDQFDPNYQ